jgi:hypothetical protein
MLSEMRNSYNILVRTPVEKRKLGRYRGRWGTILKCIIRKSELGSNGSGTMADSCKHDNEQLSSTKARKFFTI